jgi:hypothetical protein
MAAYGYIVRKFIRNGEVIPDHFTGSTPQTMTLGVTLPLLSYEASALCSAEITIPDGGNTTAGVKFLVTVPYKMRVSSSSRFVAKTGTAGNLTVALGKSTDGGTTVTGISSTTAGVTAANGVALMTTHTVANETVNPFAASPEIMVITVTKGTGANVADGTLYLNFVRAD